MKIHIKQAGIREQAFVFLKRISESDPFDGVTYNPSTDRVGWHGYSQSTSLKVDLEAQTNLHLAAKQLGMSSDEVLARINALLSGE